MKHLLKQKKGFTLIELIVSLTILSIIVVPLSTMFVQSIKANASARQLLRANQIAQKYMERLKADINNGVPTEEDGFQIQVEKANFEPPSGAVIKDYDLPTGKDNNAYESVITISDSDSNITGGNGNINFSTDCAVKLDITSSDFTLTKDASSATCYRIPTVSNYKIKLIDDTDKNICLVISNNVNTAVSLYIFRKKQGNLSVINQKGSIVTYDNNYEDSESTPATALSRLKSIKISVSGNVNGIFKKLVELTSLKNAE